MNIKLKNLLFSLTFILSQYSCGTVGQLQMESGIPVLVVEIPCYHYSLAQPLVIERVDGSYVSIFEILTDVQESLAKTSRAKSNNDRQECGGLGFGVDPQQWQISVYGRDLALYSFNEILQLIASKNNIVQVDVQYLADIY